MKTLLSLLIASALVAAVSASDSSDKPNIIVILADDYGWGSVGCHGAPPELKTPNLDRLASEGRRFTQAYAPSSLCSPSRYALMTGRYYWRTSVKDGFVLPVDAPLHIETNRLTLASLCKSQGYSTAAIGKWHLGLTNERVKDWSKPLRPGPRDIGFDYYHGLAANIYNGPHSLIENEEVSGRIPGESIAIRNNKVPANNTTTGIQQQWEPDRVMETLTKSVTQWIEANHDRPFFMYYAPIAVHEPITPHPQFTGSPYGKYGDFIQELDWSVGQILEQLDKLKLTDKTLVIFTSDNGGVINPGNRSSSEAIKAGLAINGPLRGGKNSEWEGGFREPFIVRWPGRVPAGTVSDQVICLTDVLATVAGIFQVPLPKDNAEDSFDMLRAFTETQPGKPIRDHVIVQAGNAIYGLRMGDWKLIERANVPEFESVRKRSGQKQTAKGAKATPKEDELFNLKDDPAETQNVLAANTEIAAKMREFLSAAREQGYTRPDAVSATPATRAADGKPNFLFVYTDDQRWDAMGVVQREQGDRARFPWFQTPNMDRLAAEGVRFRNAFVTLSLCAPSRAAFLTGRYNHLNGVANNSTPFPEDNVTHASLLRTAGYTTAYIGKWHMDQQRGQRPGFDYSASFVGQGRYFDCPFEINGQVTPTSGWVDDVSTDYAIEFMKKHRDRPFSLVVGYKACHGPYDLPERAKDRFANAVVRPVPNLDVRAIYQPARDEQKKKEDAASRPAANQRNKGLLDYLRSVSTADDNLGRLLAALDDLGLAENTVVVFASDNGYYRGEHGLGDKRTAYDESLRIPLIIRYPKLAPRGKVLDEMVLNIDLAPTLLELAGVAVPSDMQGRSWLPLLTGQKADWRKAFLAEYFLENQYPQIPSVVAVRTETAKLIKYPGHEEWTELFDLANDPYETKNLVGDPRYHDLWTKMNDEFERQVKITGYVVPDYADKPGEAPERPAPKKADKPRKNQPT